MPLRRMRSPRHLLCIVPPYSIKGPPLAAAALLGFMRAHGHRELGFLDLRLGTSDVYAPTYTTTGAAGETYVMDVPDLPLVLRVLARRREAGPIAWDPEAPAIAAYCRERGIDAAFLCRYLTGLTRYLEGALGRLEELSFIGFSVWASNYLSTMIACTIVRRRWPRATIVLGGPQVTEGRGAARLALASELADRVVRGEGEQALLEIYEDHLAGRLARPERIDDAIVERPLLRVKEKPLPDFGAMDLAAYQFRDGGVSLPFELSRGCTDKCSFCSEWVFWRKYRSDDPLRVVAQLEELTRRHGATDIYFVDSLLNGVPARLESFAEALLGGGLRLTWGGFMRASMDLEKARLLRRAGLRRVFVGIESMSDETLLLMNKRRTQADNIAALAAFLGAGLESVDCGVIPGFPGDTRERFAATLGELVRLRDAHPQLDIKIEPFSVTPGQPVFQRLAEFGLAPAGWSPEVLELAPEFADITATLAHSVTGANQGTARSEATRLAYALVRPDAGAARFDPFAYSRREDLVDAEPRAWPVVERDGAVAWYTLLAKSRAGERRVVIAAAAELAALRAALAATSTPDERREVVWAALERLSALQLRSGEHRACWPSELRAAPGGEVVVHPALVVRDSEAHEVGLVLVHAASPGRALTCDRGLAPLFCAELPLADEPWRARVAALLPGAEPAAASQYAAGLLAAACFVVTGAPAVDEAPPGDEPTLAPRPADPSLITLRRPDRAAKPA